MPLSRSAQNFAPIKPIRDLLEQRKPNKHPTKFESAFKEWYTAKLNYERAARDETISMAQLVSLFRKGQQLNVQRRPFGAPGYYVRPYANDDTYRQTALNFMSFHSQVGESKMLSSNPTVNMRAADDTPEAIAAAQACRPVVDCYETEWYTAKFSRREAIRYLTDGMVIYQVRWNPFKGEYKVAERTVSRREITIDAGRGLCADCDYEGEADEFPPTNFGFTCPQCQSPAVDLQPAQKRSLAQIGMGQPKPMGEPELIVSSFMSWHWDMKVDLERSPWAIKRQYITQGAVNLMFGDVVIPSTGTSDDYGLDVLHALAYSGQSFQGSSWSNRYGHFTDNERRPTMFEAWLSPEEQALIECDEGDTIAGVTMPAGRLSKFCQGKPCCVVGLNDSALIVGVFVGESQQQEVITAQWFMDADSGGGRGLEDLAGVQKRSNAVDGQIYQGLAMTATPAILLDKSILKEDDGKYLFRPGQNIDVNLSMLPPNTSLKDAFFIGTPGAVSQQYIQYGQMLMDQMASLSSLAVEFSESGLPIDNRTATGAQITAGLANSLYGPMLMSKGESRVEIAKKIVQLTSEHAIAGRYYPGKGAAKGRMVSGENLRGKVIFDLAQGSELPTTPFSRQTDVRVFGESFGGMLVAAQVQAQFPKFFSAMSKPFNLEFDTETEDEVSNLCLKRLEQMKAGLQMGITDPSQLVAQIKPAIRLTEPKHKEKATWYSDWQDLESAQEAPEELRQAVENLYWLHQNYSTQKQLPEAANQGAIQAAQMAPAAMGASALQGQQEPPQQEDKSAELGAKMQIEQMKAEKDVHLKEIELDTQKEVARTQSATMLKQTAMQGENQLENTRLAGENAVRVQKSKPKPAAKSA